jgi:hypothetical protein
MMTNELSHPRQLKFPSKQPFELSYEGNRKYARLLEFAAFHIPYGSPSIQAFQLQQK